MSDVLCMYYSRTGNTKKAMLEIATELNAEVVELKDAVERGGWQGWLRCGLDAMKKTTQPLSHFETERPLSEYRLVILGTPVWAGRCSSVMRTLLKDRGGELERVAYVITRSRENRYQAAWDQLDLYVPGIRRAAVSLRSGSVGYDFWKEEFLRQVKEFLAQ